MASCFLSSKMDLFPKHALLFEDLIAPWNTQFYLHFTVYPLVSWRHEIIDVFVSLFSFTDFFPPEHYIQQILLLIQCNNFLCRYMTHLLQSNLPRILLPSEIFVVRVYTISVVRRKHAINPAKLTARSRSCYNDLLAGGGELVCIGHVALRGYVYTCILIQYNKLGCLLCQFLAPGHCIYMCIFT